MKKVIVFLFLLPVFLVGCTKESKEQAKENTMNSSSPKIVDASSSELEGVPAGKLPSKVNDREINSFTDYDKLSQTDKNSLLYNYLLKALDSLGQGEEGAKKILNDLGYHSADDSDLETIFSKLRTEFPNKDYNELLIEFVGKIMVVEKVREE